MAATKETVCVTGGSGFIGSCLVRLLLERGYSVHAAVKDLGDEKETSHLEALEGTGSRLRLFQIDLLDYASLLTAIQGSVGVFHLASPCTVDRVLDPEVKEYQASHTFLLLFFSRVFFFFWLQKEVLDPAVKGTLNVLRAAKESGVRRVVVTSSISAIIPSPGWPDGVERDEECWTDVEYCKKNELWYPASKTLAEKAAWKFARENELDIVVVNPGTVMGPIIPPTIGASMIMLDRLLKGCIEEYQDFYMGPVHVKDVALAHILVYESTSASGRHLCLATTVHWSDFAAKVAELYPEYKVPRFEKDTQPGLLRVQSPSKKLMELGFQFSSMEEIIKDSVGSLKSRGYLS